MSTKKKYVKVFGTVIGENGPEEFTGQLVKIEHEENSKQVFYMNGKKYLVHSKQLEDVELLYPNEIYVREPGFSETDPDKVEIVKSEIANCYARRGSHWIRYFIDPASLIVVGEDDDEVSREQARIVSDVIVGYDLLHAILESEGLTEDQVKNILMRIG